MGDLCRVEWTKWTEMELVCAVLVQHNLSSLSAAKGLFHPENHIKIGP